MKKQKCWELDRKIPHMSKIENFKKKMQKDFKISKLMLFGSFARGDYKKWSDVDLLIVSKDFKKFKKVQRAAKLYDYWTYKYPVDFLCYTPEEFNKLKKQITIVREAVKEGIVI